MKVYEVCGLGTDDGVEYPNFESTDIPSMMRHPRRDYDSGAGERIFGSHGTDSTHQADTHM